MTKMFPRQPFQFFSIAAFMMLTSSACMSEASDDTQARAGGLFEEEYEAPLSQPYFIVTRVDTRKCMAPHCGGWFVKWLDAELTPCADGSWQPECHMYAPNFAQLGLDPEEVAQLVDDLATGKVLARGQLVAGPAQEYKGAATDTLVVSEILEPTEATLGPAGGHLEVVEGPLAGVVVDVPAGAVDEPTAFFIQARDRLTLGDLDASVGPAAELGPHDVEFLAPISVTMPLTEALEPGNPVLMLQERDQGRRLVLPQDPEDQLQGQIRVEVGGFSVFQPFQRDIEQMVADAESKATCEELDQLADLAEPWTEHVYFYEGLSINGTVFGFQGLGGVDAVYDIYNSQVGSFWYLGVGLYTQVLGGGGTAYAGWGIGDRNSVHDAWSGNVVGASGDLDLGSTLSGFLGLSAGASVFITCADLSAQPGIPNNRFCYPEEIQSPWQDAVFGAGGTVGLGLNVFPEFGSVGNLGVTNGWWTSWQLYNSLLSGILGFASIPHEVVEIPVSPPAVGDTATYLQIESPDGTELGRGREMARAILLTAAAPEIKERAAELAILQGLARDEAMSLAEYCTPPGSRCISGQLQYTSSNNCISGTASGTAEVYRYEDNVPVFEGEIELGEDGSFCLDMSGDDFYRIVQYDQDGSGCWPGYLVECNYWIQPGVGDEGGVCSLDTCENLGDIEFDCGS